MDSPFTARQTGFICVTAAGLILVSQVSQLVLPMTMPESFWVATQSLRMGLALLAMFVLLIALTGLYTRNGAAMGRIGLVGYLTAFLGSLLVAGNWWYEAFIGPSLREQAPELLATAPGGSILIGAVLTAATFATGWTMFGIASYRAAVVPAGAAALTTIGGIAGVLAFIAPFQIPLALAVGWIGSSLARSDEREVQPQASQATAVV
jgi:hypothetical protein